VVSKAFQVLSDPQKRRVFDQTGGDPEARFGGAGGGMHPEGNPFARFGGASAGRPMFEGADVSAEELFNMFFGGGLGGGIFSEMTGGQFAPFGGPGVRVHQFGGDPRARRRTAPQPERTAAAEEPTSFSRMLLQLLPLLIFFILPLLSNLFAGVADVPRGPQFSMDPVDPYTHVRYTPVHKIPFYVNPKDLVDLSVRDLVNIEKRAENTIVAEWNNECRREEMRRDQAIQDATGIIFTNHEKLKQAKQMPMPKCRKLEHLGERRRREL
jgi:DnaJ family protein B protein 12